MSEYKIGYKKPPTDKQFPVNRKDHTQKGPCIKPLMDKLAKRKWPMQSPTGEVINMQGDVALLTAAWWEGLRGDITAIKEIWDRMYGKVPQKNINENTGEVKIMGTIKVGGNPIEVKIGD